MIPVSVRATALSTADGTQTAMGVASSGGSEVLRFRSSGVAGVLVHDGAGVTPHRWLKVAFIPSHLVKATFSHHRAASEATTVTPTTNAPPRTPLSLQKSHTQIRQAAASMLADVLRQPDEFPTNDDPA